MNLILQNNVEKSHLSKKTRMNSPILKREGRSHSGKSDKTKTKQLYLEKQYHKKRKNKGNGRTNA